MNSPTSGPLRSLIGLVRPHDFMYKLKCIPNRPDCDDCGSSLVDFSSTRRNSHKHYLSPALSGYHGARTMQSQVKAKCRPAIRRTISAERGYKAVYIVSPTSDGRGRDSRHEEGWWVDRGSTYPKSLGPIRPTSKEQGRLASSGLASGLISSVVSVRLTQILCH